MLIQSAPAKEVNTCISGTLLNAMVKQNNLYFYFKSSSLMNKNGSKPNPKKWVALYGNPMYQYVLPRVNDNIIAEDLVQETFLSALKGINRYKEEASEKTWLFSILKNKIIDYYRKKTVEQTTIPIPDLNLLEDDWFNGEGNWVENKIPREWQVNDNPMERKEIQKIINWCKDNLKALQHHVFTLKYMEDLDSVEICKVLDISPSNYWVLLHRARLQMRDCVEKNWLNN